MTKDNELIEKLRHKRKLIRQQLKTRAISGDKNNDANKLLAQYLDLTDQLAKLGFDQPHSAYYLDPSYWANNKKDLNNQNKPKPKIQKSTSKINNSSRIKINIEPKPNYYIFNLAWTEVDSKDLDKILKLIQQYFKTMQLKEISRDQNINIYTKEFIIQYELQCDAKVFDIICKSAQFIVDEMSTELTSRNIAIYGNKKEIN